MHVCQAIQHLKPGHVQTTSRKGVHLDCRGQNDPSHQLPDSRLRHAATTGPQGSEQVAVATEFKHEKQTAAPLFMHQLLQPANTIHSHIQPQPDAIPGGYTHISRETMETHRARNRKIRRVRPNVTTVDVKTTKTRTRLWFAAPFAGNTASNPKLGQVFIGTKPIRQGITEIRDPSRISRSPKPSTCIAAHGFKQLQHTSPPISNHQRQHSTRQPAHTTSCSYS
jgi:hypothetical protein